MDNASISIAIASAKTLFDMTKTMYEMTKQIGFKDKLSKFQNEIIALQSQLLTIQQEQSNLINIKNEIEQKLIDNEEWKITKECYQLTELGPGTFVYTPKKGNKFSEPFHSLCTRCFDIGKKRSIIQFHKDYPSYNELICQECNKTIKIQKETIDFPSVRTSGPY